MFLKVPGVGEAPAPMHPAMASKGGLLRRLRTLCLVLLPLLLVTSVACSKHHDTASDPGKPPAITTAPVAASTVTGRPVTFSVAATGQEVLRYQWLKIQYDKDGKEISRTNILGALGATYTIFNPRVEDAGGYTVTITNPNGTATSTPVLLTVAAAVAFISPAGIVVDAGGNAYVSDMEDHTIWKVSPSPTYLKTLLAGSPGLPGSSDGNGTSARFNTPGALALDGSGNLIVADTGNHTIRRIATDGTVTTLAGTAGLPGSANGVGALARFNAPNGLAVTGTGSIYIADAQNHTIRLLATDGTVTTFAGTAGKPGQVDGDKAAALFNQPNGLALSPNGTLYVADYGNSCIRAIAPSGAVSLLAGQYATSGFTNGTGVGATFYLPVGLTLDSTGNLYVSEVGNHALRQVTATGVTTSLAGSGTAGNTDSSGSSALFFRPCGVAITPSGNLMVADTGNHILRSSTLAGVVTTPTLPPQP